MQVYIQARWQCFNVVDFSCECLIKKIKYFWKWFYIQFVYDWKKMVRLVLQNQASSLVIGYLFFSLPIVFDEGGGNIWSRQ